MNTQNTQSPFLGKFPKQFNKDFFVFLSTVVIVFFVLILRKPDSFYNPQFWAEDGTKFFLESAKLGLDSLWITIGGYHMFVQRLIAYFFSFAPPLYLPALYNFSALLITFFVICYLFSSRINLPHKPLFALAIVFAPVYNHEVFVSLTNAMWIAGLCFPLMAISKKPVNKKDYFFDFLILTLVSISSPFATLLFILFLIRFTLTRERYFLFLFGVSLFYGLFQFSLMDTVRIPGINPVEIIVYFKVIAHYFGTLFIGNWSEPTKYQSKISIVFTLIAILLFSSIVIDSLKSKKIERIIFLTTALIIVASTLVAYREFPDKLLLKPGRYFFIPFVTSIWALLLSLNKTYIKILAIFILATLSLIFGLKFFPEIEKIFSPYESVIIVSLSTTFFLFFKKENKRIVALALSGNLVFVLLILLSQAYSGLTQWVSVFYYLIPAFGIYYLFLILWLKTELISIFLLALFVTNIMVNSEKLVAPAQKNYRWDLSAECIMSRRKCHISHPPDGWHFVYRRK